VFSEQFSFEEHTLVNFVGGGGKTTLIQKLMCEYSAKGPVLYTTTTRIHPPLPLENISVLSGDNISLIQHLVDSIGRNCSDQPYKLLATCHFMSPNLLRGVPMDFADTLDRKLFPILLNEADGAAGFSIKFPRDGEPVLLNNAEYLVPVIGLDCLGQPLGPETLFRWDISEARLSLHRGEKITPKLASSILMHKNGVCKDWKPGTTIIPFINKVDSPEQDAVAKELAESILQNENFPVKRVLFGSAFKGRVQCMATV
jgi:probable selenium-dependent hydroxylase accessory protein YqeC